MPETRQTNRSLTMALAFCFPTIRVPTKVAPIPTTPIRQTTHRTQQQINREEEEEEHQRLLGYGVDTRATPRHDIILF